MADRKITLEIEIDADGKQAAREIKRVGDAVEKDVGKSFFKASIALQAFNAALDIAINQLKSGIDAAVQYERTTNTLDQTLKSIGLTNKAWTDGLQKQAARLQNISGVSDDVIRQYQIMAINMGINVENVDDMIRAAIRMSNAFGTDVRTALTQLGKSLNGTIEETLQMVAGTKDLTTEQRRAGDAIKLTNEVLESQLTVMTQGTSGAAVGLQNAWKDMTEQMGTAVLQSGHLRDGLQSVADVLRVINDVGIRDLVRQMSAGRSFFDILFETKTGRGELPPIVDKALEERLKKFDKDVAEVMGRGRRGRRGASGAADAEETVFQGFAFDPSGAPVEQVAEAREKAEAAAHEKRRQRADESKKAADEVAAHQKAALERTTAAFNTWGQASADTLVNLALAGELTAANFAAAMMEMIGRALIADGVANMAKAAAMAFIPGSQGNAAGLAGAGAAEVAIGSGLVAGSASIGGTGANRPGGMGTSFAGGSMHAAGVAQGIDHPFFATPQDQRNEQLNNQERTITINVSGTMGPSATGVFVQRALEQAAFEGRI